MKQKNKKPKRRLTKEQKLLIKCYNIIRTYPSKKALPIYKEVQAYLDKHERV